MKFWKPSAKTVCLAIMVTVLLHTAPSWADMVDTVVAKVNKEIITLSAVMEKVRVILVRSQGIEASLPDMNELKRSILEGMVREKLILDEVKRIGLSVDEKEIQAALDDIKVRGALSDRHLKMMLEMEGKTMEEYKDEIRNQLLVTKVVNFQVRSRIKVGEDEIKKYYDAHQQDFWQAPKIHARHILFILGNELTEDQKEIKRQKAREALKRIRSGEDFIEIAKTFSEDVTAQSGGDLGVLEKGKMVSEFEEAVFSLKEGEVSDLIKTPYGLHIIRVDKIDSGNTLPLDKVQNEIVMKIRETKYSQAFEDYISELKNESFIELKWDVLIPPHEKGKTSVAKKETLSGKQTHSKVENVQPIEVGQNIEKPKAPDPKFNRMKKKLKYYKNLREMEMITEEEYQGRIRELLNNL